MTGATSRPVVRRTNAPMSAPVVQCAVTAKDGVREISPETRQRSAAPLSGSAFRLLLLARSVPSLARGRIGRSGTVRRRRQQDFRIRLDIGELFEEAGLYA